MGLTRQEMDIRSKPQYLKIRIFLVAKLATASTRIVSVPIRMQWSISPTTALRFAWI